MRKMGAMFALEGTDGVGKATQTKLLVDRLRKRGHKVLHYSFPRYDTPVGRLIGGLLKGDVAVVTNAKSEGYNLGFDPLVFQSLMLADKREADPEIYSALMDGTYVVCDRWYASALTYGASDELSLKWLENVHLGIQVPDITFLLSIPEELALARRPALRDRYEKDRVKQIRVRQLYDELAGDEEKKHGHWEKIDGSGTPDYVASQIWLSVSSFLESGEG